MASVIRGSDNFDSLVHQGIGVNQTWQDVVASRTFGTTYTNTTGKPISVWVFAGLPSVAGHLDFYIDGVQKKESNQCTSTNYSITVEGIVPNNSTYKVVSTNAGSNIKWSELR